MIYTMNQLQGGIITTSLKEPCHQAAHKSTVSVHQQDLNECIQGDSSSTEWRAELYVAFEVRNKFSFHEYFATINNK